MQATIGVFDSGFGGLDVLHHLTQSLSEYDYVYLADTARAPYGNRSPSEITTYTRQAVRFLTQRGCKLIIIACNTAVSIALDTLQQEMQAERGQRGQSGGQHRSAHAPMLIGVLQPCAESAAAHSRSGRVGLLATTRTVESGAYAMQLQQINPSIELTARACPRLVSLIETGNLENPEIDAQIHSFSQDLIKHNVDTVILGCTHFGLIYQRFRLQFPDSIHLVHAGPVVTSDLKAFFLDHPEIVDTLQKNGQRLLYTTLPSPFFDARASLFFQSAIHAEEAKLD